MPIEPPAGKAREYLAAFGVACVYVAAPPTCRPVVIGPAVDLSRAINWLRKHDYPEWNIEAAWWLRAKGQADAIARVARDYLGGLPEQHSELDATIAQASKQVEEIARQSGITLTPHDVAMARVSRATLQIEHELRRAQRDGRLAFFNRAYREHRLAGGRLHYRQAYARLRRALFARIGHGGSTELDPDLLAEIFH